ncbi:MAG: DUF115 domain-containing protein [Treponema sp.]|jgi:hypothetical protein|nr:DUF115 domain-containing protein [Treponema sp.]
MNDKQFFERNISALSLTQPSLACSLSKAKTALTHYEFKESSSGEIIPAWIDPGHPARPLHSTVDPRREAKRLMDTLGNEGFIVLLGLGGGFFAEAALEREQTARVLVIDFCIDSIAELLCHKDYSEILCDPRFHILIDPDETAIEQYILSAYQPALCEGIRMLPLRARTAADNENFGKAAEAVEKAVQKVSADYSVQAYFGARWFSNSLRNLISAEKENCALPLIKHAAVTAAGPSLNLQIPLLKKRRKTVFLIATDTSLPCLLAEDISPDAVVSIDCQHISYYHFMSGLPKETLLFMDLAGPPLVASLSKNIRFFSGSHPLTNYIKTCYSLPDVDTSGGNVTYASVSLAEKLGAESIELYGADFSYPMGLCYARGAYVHPYFEIRQKRLAPLEAQYSAFLYRGLLTKKLTNTSWYYESHSLTFYREKLEAHCEASGIDLIPQDGLGSPIQVFPKKINSNARQTPPFTASKARMKAEDFLADYSSKIRSLPVFVKNYTEFLKSLETDERLVFFTILPTAAALKRRDPALSVKELIEKTKSHCIARIEKVLN